MKKITLLLTAFAFLALCSGPLLAAPVIPASGSVFTTDATQRMAPMILPIPAAPTWVDAMFLSANTAASYSVPTGANYLLFSGNASFYVSLTGTAVIPTGNVTNGTAPLLNPAMMPTTGLATQTLSFISPVACIVTSAVIK